MATTKEETKLPVKEVESAVLHSAIMLSGKTETHLGQTKVPGIKLSWNSDGLIAEFKGKSCLVPSAAVKVVYFK